MNAKKKSFLSSLCKHIGIALTIVGMIVGSAVWVMAADSSDRQFAIDQANAVKQDVDKLIQNYYASKEDVGRIQEKLEEQNRKIDEANKKLDKIIDRLLGAK
jgi:hypothetical protein